MNTARWPSRAAALIVAIGVVVFSNPEARALLLLADAIGLELLALMLLVQFRSALPVLSAVTQVGLAAVCAEMPRASRVAARLIIGLLGSRQSLVQPAQAICHRVGRWRRTDAGGRVDYHAPHGPGGPPDIRAHHAR